MYHYVHLSLLLCCILYKTAYIVFITCFISPYTQQLLVTRGPRAPKSGAVSRAFCRRKPTSKASKATETSEAGAKGLENRSKPCFFKAFQGSKSGF